MATRCVITIRDKHGKEYSIYRHNDGYPEGVVSDLHLLSLFYKRNPIDNPEYFLANFIFYAKLSFWMDDHKIYKVTEDEVWKSWEYGYGVCASNQEFKCIVPRHLDYRYLIYPKDDEVMLKIEMFSFTAMDFETIFDGKLERAFEKYANGKGCHLKPDLLS